MEVELEQDIRIIRRNLAKGFISTADMQAKLADLPDVQDQGEWFDPTLDAEPDSSAASTPESEAD